jgi:hypothetical protein
LSNQSIDFGFFYGILLQAGIVENRLWNGLVEPIDLLWIFLGRCSTLELSKIDFGMVLSNQSIDFGFFWDAAASWNCRKSTLELSCGTNRSDRLWNLFMDAARRWNCRKSTLELSSMPMAKTAKRKVNRMILESSDGCVLVVKKCTCHCICANSKGAHFKIDGDIEHIISMITSLHVTWKG